MFDFGVYRGGGGGWGHKQLKNAFMIQSDVQNTHSTIIQVYLLGAGQASSQNDFPQMKSACLQIDMAKC